MKQHSNFEAMEMSYFRLNLLSYLQDCYPDKANDYSFIIGRGDLAAESYSQAIKSGSNHIQASEIANEALFKDLHFSPYSLILQILRNEFSNEISPESAQTKAKELFPQCRELFASYDLNDEFDQTTEYQLLYTELTGTIQILL